MKKIKNFRGYIYLILFSIFTGTIGVFARLTEGVNVFNIIFFRAIIATIFIFAWIAIKKDLKSLKLKNKINTFLVGGFQGLTFFFYFSSVFRTSIANTSFLLYTAPIFSIFLAKYFLKEKIQKKTMIGLFLVMIGIILILDPRMFSFSSKETIGNLLGLCAGFSYAVMALVAKPLLKKTTGYYVAFWQYLVIAILYLFSINKSVIDLFLINWWQLLFMGIICTGIAYVFFMKGVQKVKAQEVFIVTSLEPLVATFFALILLKESPTLFTIFGAIFILFGVYKITNIKNI